MITVKNLHKSFGSVKAVDNLSFTIKKGEIIGFLGPNGAGKTTTMRLMTGYLSPDQGKIVIDGQDIAENPKQIQSKIGYLPENNPLYKDMLVSEMLGFAADLKRIPHDNRKEAFDFAVEAVAIEDVFYRRIGELSKGYKQRVGMALALLHRPKIIIMDEPSEGLDPNQRTEIRSLIKELAKDRTIILSTHVMQEAIAVSNRILIINKGKLVADGSPEDLTHTSKSEKTLEVHLEGRKIKSLLPKIPGVKDVVFSKPVNKIYTAELIIDAQAQIQPELSKLIAKESWVLWHLSEKHTNLEDVFQQLTNKKK